MTDLLTVKDVNTGYEGLQILWDVSLSVSEGERVILLGANGAGKTTLLKTLVGLLPTWSGEIQFDGKSIQQQRSDTRIRGGIAYLSELGVVPSLSIEDNLRLGGYYVARRSVGTLIEEMYAEFPALREKRKALASSLSGGQRKMLSVAKALMSQPKLLVMDEPSAGLSPLLVSEVLDILRRFHDRGLSFLIAEQNVKFIEIADKAYVLNSGRTEFGGTVEELHANDAIRRAYFGISH